MFTFVTKTGTFVSTSFIIDVNISYKEYDDDLFYCYIAKDNQSGNKVLVKSYKENFMEKNNQTGESELYSLDEFSKHGNKDIRKAYLIGRYGAIPNIR